MFLEAIGLLVNFIILLFIVYFFNSIRKEYRPLMLVLLLGAFTNVLQIVLWSYEGINFLVYNIIFIAYTIIAFSLLLYFFKNKFQDPILKGLFYGGIAAIILSVIIRDYYFDLINDNSKSTPTPLIGTIFIVAACLRVLFLFLKRVDSVVLYKKLDFWLVLIIMYYFVFQFVCLGYYNFFYAGLFKSYILFDAFEYIHHIYYFSVSLLIVIYASTKSKRLSNSLLHL